MRLWVNEEGENESGEVRCTYVLKMKCVRDMREQFKTKTKVALVLLNLLFFSPSFLFWFSSFVSRRLAVLVAAAVSTDREALETDGSSFVPSGLVASGLEEAVVSGAAHVTFESTIFSAAGAATTGTDQAFFLTLGAAGGVDGTVFSLLGVATGMPVVAPASFVEGFFAPTRAAAKLRPVISETN